MWFATTLVVVMALTGCSAGALAPATSSAAAGSTRALDKASLRSLVPSSKAAGDAVGTDLSLEGNLETRARNTASPKPTIGLTRCELSLNEWTYPPYSEVVQQTYNGPDGLYALLYYRFASDLTAAAYVKATTNVGKYCSSVPSSGVAAWDNGIPNTVGFSRTKNSTEQLTFFRQGKIVAGVDGASQELTTKLLQLQIRTIAAVK